MKQILIIISVIAIAVAAQGCAKRPSPDDRILAQVSSKFITLKELKDRIAKLPPYYQDVVNKNKKRFLDETILEMLFYEEAIRKGLDRDKEVQEIINEARKKIVIAKLIKIEVEDKIKVTDDEMKKFYEAHKEEFKTPELTRASHILVATEVEAKDLRDRILKGENFEELAKKYSMDATASRGGDIGFFRAGQLVPEFENVCLKLNPGELSEVVHTQFGYHIIKLTDRKAPAAEPYEKVKRGMEGELKKKDRSELFDKLVMDLKKKYKVEIKEDVFKSLEALNDEKKTAAK